MVFTFAGTKINKKGANGPYRLQNVSVARTNGAPLSMSWYKVHTTAPYTAAQFEPPLACGGPVPPAVNAAFEQRVIELVNIERANQGLPPMKRVELLMGSARYHANDMKVDDYYDHNSHDRINGVLTFVCNWDERINSFYPTQWFLAENIAGAVGSPEAVVAAWMASPGHRTNILGGYREIGVGYDTNWVQNFRHDPNVYPLIINGEAATTSSPNVTLYVYGEWTEIRLRNNGGAWSAWQPFTNTLSWTLDAAPGLQTVEAEFRDATTTVAASDTIETVALFSNTHDNLLDIDSNGLADQLQISTIVGLPAGDYTWSGRLVAPNGVEVATSSGAGELYNGATVVFAFNSPALHATGQAGPYELRDVTITDQRDPSTPTVTPLLYTTPAYALSTFEDWRLQMAGDSVEALDIDGNGLYDKLRFHTTLTVPWSAQYYLGLHLYSPTGVDIASYGQIQTYSGTSSQTVEFSGEAINAATVDGPYVLRLTAVELYPSGGGVVRLGLAQEVASSAAYQASQFQGFPVLPPPAAPTLAQPDNPDNDGNYAVSWTGVAEATGYELQQKSGAFGEYATVYTGAATLVDFTAQSPTIYRRPADADANADSRANQHIDAPAHRQSGQQRYHLHRLRCQRHGGGHHIRR
jgi:uncharacterized protein YkwD